MHLVWEHSITGMFCLCKVDEQLTWIWVFGIVKRKCSTAFAWVITKRAALKKERVAFLTQKSPSVPTVLRDWNQGVHQHWQPTQPHLHLLLSEAGVRTCTNTLKIHILTRLLWLTRNREPKKANPNSSQISFQPPLMQKRWLTGCLSAFLDWFPNKPVLHVVRRAQCRVWSCSSAHRWSSVQLMSKVSCGHICKPLGLVLTLGRPIAPWEY